MMIQKLLTEIHRRAHTNLAALLDHCAQLPEGAIDRELDGFGYPTIRLQLHHLIGAEEYWIGVLKSDFRAEDDDYLYPTIDSLEEYRGKTAAATIRYLEETTEEELLTSCMRMTWRKVEKPMIPAHVVMRTQTHIYHHQGQILAMCRLLGHPGSGNDYPID